MYTDCYVQGITSFFAFNLHSSYMRVCSYIDIYQKFYFPTQLHIGMNLPGGQVA